jgi:hypothetical protein
MPITTIPNLDYASRYACPRRLLRHTLIAAIFVGLCLPALLIGSKTVPAIWNDYQIHRLTDQCLSNTLPPDFIVLTNDPTEVAKLQASGKPGYTFDHDYHRPATARYYEPHLLALEGRTDPVTTGTGGTGGSTVFLHELSTPSGLHRLVRISCARLWSMHPSDVDLFQFYAGTINSANITKPLRWTPIDIPRGILSEWGHIFPEKTWRKRDAPFTIYAGQLDPNDPSHFSIRCRRGSDEGFIDGSLFDTPDDGPLLHFRARNESTQARIEYFQRLQSYSPPSTQVVFESDPTIATALCATGLYTPPNWFIPDYTSAALPVPEVWQNWVIPYPQITGWHFNRGLPG